MKISLILQGKSDFDYLREGMSIYSSRLVHYLPFEIIELPAVKASKSMSPQTVMEQEANALLKKWPSGASVILLDEKGSEMNSIEFSGFISGHMNRGTRHLVFVVGGAYGFHESIKQRSSGLLSLSKMTFSHQIIRVIFLEQLYRAMTILKNEPYHNP